MEKLLKAAANRIKELRLSKKKGQTEVAKALKISVAALSKIENGLTDLNLSRIAQIAQYFEVSLTQIIAGEDCFNIKNTQNNTEEVQKLQQLLQEKDIELMSLQKKVIQLYEKLGL